MIGKGRADHNLHIWINLPQAGDGLDAVPSRRHAHIDKGQRVGVRRAGRLFHQAEARFSLFGKIHREGFALNRHRRLAEERCPRLIEHVGGVDRHEDFRKSSRIATLSSITRFAGYRRQ